MVLLMPLRYSTDPFADISSNISINKLCSNPYRNKVINAKNQKLPIFHGAELKKKSGTWCDVISNLHQTNTSKTKLKLNRPKLIVEIGCHFGNVLASMAKDHDNHLFLGMDITFKRVYKSAKSITDHKLTNAAVIYCNAHNIDKIFSPKEITGGVVIFFPDPWDKKKSQIANSLINEKFIKNLQLLLSSQSFVWIKTDHLSNFIVARKLLIEHKFHQKPIISDHWILDGNKSVKDNYCSFFEQRFQQKKIDYYQGLFIK